MAKVSVLIPTYNCEKFIGETLDHVLSQTCQDLEILVVDDGSQDATGAIVERYAAQHPLKVRLLCQQNKGPGAARNRGLRNAAGEYIAFLDADDLWKPEKLEKQVAVLDHRPEIGLVYCDNYYVDEKRRIKTDHVRRYRLPEGNITMEFFHHYFMVTSAVMARRSCIEQTGFFREDMMVGEDYDYFMRLSYRCSVAFIEEKLYEKRCLETSLSNRDKEHNSENDILLLTDFVRREPEFYRTHRAFIDQRLGSYSFSIGYQGLWWEKNGNVARRFLLNSLRFRRSLSDLLKVAKCLGISFFPYGIRRQMKTMVSGKEFYGTE
jgi:glycosyltransferase involved in cell wall biosynthesis